MRNDIEVAAVHNDIHGKDYHDPPPAPLFDHEEFTKWSFYRAIIAEFIATLLFLYITVLTVISDRSQTDPNLNLGANQCSGVGVLGIAWAFGGMIFILVYSTAGISGGHINPAVTFGLFLARKVRLTMRGTAGGANEVAYGYSVGTGLSAEIVGTFILVYIVLAATDPKRNARDSHVPVLAPLPIGFAVFSVHLATLPLTGTGINPARSLGAAVVYNRKKAWHDHVLDFLGWTLHWCCNCCIVSPIRPQSIFG
ncbi:hypothetical protein Patl1_32088 [Pistacia atlantica]|uniref:Uncharacterized protein n=1 Tax=Pistacia atlantica TaxID=434234 RepID=A0ACC1ARW2_9ROSI|nr:hypothetical protein Patl1_32088 [Pistacia atlantica]